MDYKDRRWKACYFLMAILGTAFCLYYVRNASANVVYSDYIRLIISYLPDVTNPLKLFVPDIFTRVPLTYLARIINVKLFSYNTFFDMGLGVASMGLGALVLAWYAGSSKELDPFPVMVSLVIYFGLNKWEMLTNGTGWVCFLSISGFLMHFVVLDHAIMTDFSYKWDRALLMLLPPFIILTVAGPYCAGYAGIVMLFYLGIFVRDFQRKQRQNRHVIRAFLSVALSMALYLLSNHFAVYEIRDAEAVGASMAGEFLTNPLFFVRFGLKALASALVGEAQITSFLEVARANNSFLGNENIIYTTGAVVFGLYLLALYWTVKFKIYKKSVFPLMLLLSGGADHILVLMARWIFLKESYGMSSRYELQYQLGLLGILFTIGFVIPEVRDLKTRRKTLLAGILITIIIFNGSLWSTVEEMDMAKYRRHFLKEAQTIGLNYREASDEDLHTYFQHDPEKVRQALAILEENHLNIFR